jgi:hypothetical protein
MGTHHWEILARIFGIIQLLNLVSHSSTTSCYQFFSFSFFDYIYLLLPLSPSLSHSLSYFWWSCYGLLINFWYGLSNVVNIVMVKGYAHLHAPGKIRSSSRTRI